MSTHIGARPGEIAPIVLMPGDPLRAQVDRRDLPRGRPLLQRGPRHVRLHRHLARPAGLGAGLGDGPAVDGDLRSTSCSRSTTSQTIVRVGSCGALTEKLAVRDIVHRLRRVHRLLDEPDPLRGPRLRPGRRLRPAARRARRRRGAGPRRRRRARRADLLQRLLLQPAARADRRGWWSYGVLAVEMEASALYTLAAQHGRRALAICTVSDHIVTGEETTRPGARADLRRPWSRSPWPPRPADGLGQAAVAESRQASASQRPARSGRSVGSTSSPVRT